MLALLRSLPRSYGSNQIEVHSPFPDGRERLAAQAANEATPPLRFVNTAGSLNSHACGAKMDSVVGGVGDAGCRLWMVNRESRHWSNGSVCNALGYSMGACKFWRSAPFAGLMSVRAISRTRSSLSATRGATASYISWCTARSIKKESPYRA